MEEPKVRRPTFSQKQKEKRALARKLKKENKKKLATSTKKYVEKTLKEITKPDLKPLSNEISLATQPLKSDLNGLNFNVEEIDNKLPEIISLETEEKISKLNERILVLENENFIFKKKLEGVEKVLNEWNRERLLTKELIRIEEDLIQTNENLLREIPMKTSESFSDLPDFVRNILYFFFGQPDEKHLLGAIARSESKILKRRGQLISINGPLSECCIVAWYGVQQINELEETIVRYRIIRGSFGRDYRDLQEQMKKDSIIKNQQQILQAFNAKIKEMNAVGKEFGTKMNESKKMLTDSYKNFQTFQQNALELTNNEKNFNKLDSALQKTINFINKEK